MKWQLAGLALILGLIAPAISSAQTGFDAKERLAPIKDYVDEHTVAIVRVDLQKLDPAAAGKYAKDAAPPGLIGEQEMAQVDGGLALLVGARAKLQAAGLTEGFVTVRLAPTQAASNPAQGPPVVIVLPVQAGKDPQAAQAALAEFLPAPTLVKGRNIVLFPPGAEELWANVRPKERADFVAGFQAAGNTTVQAVFVPNDLIRQFAQAPQPGLQAFAPLIQGLAQKLKWTALTLNSPPSPAVALIIEMEDKESAELIQSSVKLGLAMAAQQPQVKDQLPNAAQLAELLTPKLRGETQLRIVLSENNGGIKALSDAAVAGAASARKAAAAMQGMNNLKQIGLAMHNYHDTYRAFPPQAMKSKDGKVTLSWRVMILPFLGHDELFKQFNLEEPWDSEHNSKLIARMPAVYASPSMPADKNAKGMTGFVAPVAKGTIWEKDGGGTIASVLDGTSNTIMVVEALPAKAVIWTKPEDLNVDEQNPLQGLVDQPTSSFHAVFCDGAVRKIVGTVDKKIAWWLFQIADGNPVGGNF